MSFNAEPASYVTFEKNVFTPSHQGTKLLPCDAGPSSGSTPAAGDSPLELFPVDADCAAFLPVEVLVAPDELAPAEA
jgi:hypothetical protein